MFKDLWEKRAIRKPTSEEIRKAMEENIKAKQELIDELVEQLAAADNIIKEKDQMIQELEREIETISTGLTGC